MGNKLTKDGFLDPDMPTDALLLMMGEMTMDEILSARSAIRIANVYARNKPKQKD